MNMRKSVLTAVLCCVMLYFSGAAMAQGFLFSVDILKKGVISAFKDDALVDKYIDVMIELEAVTTFYNKAGMSPKEFEQYKKLLRFRTDLILEMEKREIEIPRVK